MFVVIVIILLFVMIVIKKKKLINLIIVLCVRQHLYKISRDENCYFVINYFYFLKFFFIYILAVIIPSNIILSYFPDNMNYSIIINDKNLFSVIINMSNIITIPYILYYYQFSYYIMLFMYCFINIFFFNIILF